MRRNTRVLEIVNERTEELIKSVEQKKKKLSKERSISGRREIVEFLIASDKLKDINESVLKTLRGER